MSDNRQIIVHSEGREHFDMAVQMCFSNTPGGKAKYYIKGLPERNCSYDHCAGSGKLYKTKYEPPTGTKGNMAFSWSTVEVECGNCGGTGKAKSEDAMILLWCNPKSSILEVKELPFPLEYKEASDFLWQYLQQSEYPVEPDHDGSNHRGYVVTTGNYWGHIENMYQTVLKVAPEWQMYGK
jgi:hypothetical protein